MIFWAKTSFAEAICALEGTWIRTWACDDGAWIWVEGTWTWVQGTWFWGEGIRAEALGIWHWGERACAKGTRVWPGRIRTQGDGACDLMKWVVGCCAAQAPRPTDEGH